MRFQASVLAVAASAALVSAQNANAGLSAVPSCAVPCFTEALPASGCAVTDVKCQCTTGRDPLTAALMKCVPTKCSPEELANLQPALVKLCEQAGVTLSGIPSATATASGSSPMASGVMPSGSTPSGSMASGAPTATRSGAPQQTQNAAAGMAVEFGAIAMGIAAVFGL
ncbi:hypothetical protein CFE70_009788 [Pyrenophora teres f. teres 0-1]|uniref:CFEM domain-containing protein n=2 Tax=Pyrenophora teres f. teres TaxID=97479 RepID=E3RP98_PYRTT|nr:hypothetical protein PTT_10449 [Pyrenophora teres f. teres 0-1]KAE8826999.1 hypothetical protein HRS9139_08171 [Pyrenophora teres f. teres]CAA9966692.1 CFEM multi-domain protein [Pyrenophora teres f. maculata]KAE8832516.1 hypothetical protein PTNB85_06908 [Pyrenophora teres f. teres]KAE8836875.1 hypothetical protein HRS9122_07030 [Pyrenophora teres f. teres]